MTNRKDRFGGLHFFFPLTFNKLLEVIHTEETSTVTFNKIKNFGDSLGKVCIKCKDTPGFIGNALMIPNGIEALRLLHNGVASAKDIDKAMKVGYGYPVGPFELFDTIGLETNLNILKVWSERNPSDDISPQIKILENLVTQGKLGMKSGEGFFMYSKL